MTSSAERIEEALAEAGFVCPIPQDDQLFSAGDGDVIEDAPLGYYRFHFWKTDDIPKDHDNHVALTKEAGPVCLSIIKDSTYYRILIRTIFGFKSMILKDADLRSIFGNASPSSQQLLTISLHHFVGNEREKAILTTDDDACSYHSNMSGLSTRSDRTKFLPHSRLRKLESSPVPEKAAASTALPTGTLDVRRNSIRRKGELSMSKSPSITMEEEDASSIIFNTTYTATLQEEFKAFARAKPSDLARMCTRIDNPLLPRALLAQENSLIPTSIHIDVIKCNSIKGEEPKSWDCWLQLLGTKIEKGSLLRQSIQEKICAVEADANRIMPSSKMESLSLDAAKLLQKGPLEDLVQKEANYFKTLKAMEKVFVLDLADKKIVDSWNFNIMFGMLSKLVRAHEELSKCLQLADIGDICEALARLFRQNLKFRHVYQQYCSQQTERDRAVKDEIAKNQSFSQFCDDVHKQRLFELKRLDQLLMTPVQRVVQYKLHIADLLKNTHPQDPVLPSIKDAHAAAASFASFVDSVVDLQKGLEQLLSIPMKVKGCPGTFASGSSGRFLIFKMGFIESSNLLRSSKSGVKLTVFLFNDYLLMARKCLEQSKARKAKRKDGIVERKNILNTHELIFGATIDLVSIIRGHKDEYIELRVSDPYDERILLLQTLRPLDISGLFRLIPIKKEKLVKFNDTFKILQDQQTVQRSPASIYLQSHPAKEIYYYVFETVEAYATWSQKNKIGLLYLDNVLMPDLQHFDLAGVSALGVVQAKNEAFRLAIRNRALLYASDSYFDTPKAFSAPNEFARQMAKAILNCGTLLNIYPPFKSELIKQQQLHLQNIAKSFKDSFKSKIKSLTGFGKWKIGRSKGEDDELAQRLWNESMSMLAEETRELALDDQHAEPAPAEELPRVFSAPIRKPATKSSAQSSPLRQNNANFFVGDD